MPGAAETSLLAPDAIARWRLYAAMEESIRLHAQEQAAVQVRALVVMPYVPGQGSRRELLRSLRRRGSLGRAPLQRGADEHRRAAAASLAHTELFRAELEGLRLPTRLLNGEQLAELYWQRFNPTVADHSRSGGQALGAEVLCDLEGVSARYFSASKRPPRDQLATS